MIAETMRTRRSVRKYKNDKVPRDILRELIDIAVTAPSASNHQPWRFFVVDRQDNIEAIAADVQSAIDHIVAQIQPQFHDNFKKYGDYFVRFKQAPTLIVPAFREMQMLSNMLESKVEAGIDTAIRVMEFNSGIVSTSLAIQNLLLYAHHIGLGASCMTGPLVALNAIKSRLGIPDTWQVACFIPVGYPDEIPEVKPRKSSDQVIRWVDELTEPNQALLEPA